jgi:predicted amidohydrolase YtcJ
MMKSRGGRTESDLILTGGTVLTMDDGRPQAEAVAVTGDRILAVGSSEEVASLAGHETRVVDLDGRTVLPGFIDAHVHLLREGGRRSWVDLSGVASVKDLRARLSEGATRCGLGGWVLGKGWDESSWRTRRFPTLAELDYACPRTPVLIVRVDGHAGVVNSAALSALQIPTSLQGVGRESGRPTGLLVEDALKFARRQVRATGDLLLKELPRMIGVALSHGITSIQDVVSPEDVGLYERARKAGVLDLRATLMPIATDEVTVPELEEDEFLRLGPVKIFADGSYGARTAALHKDYEDETGNRGMLVHSRGKLESLISEAHSQGSPTAVHAIGDRGIAEVLDAYEDAGTLPGDRVEHFELPRDEGISSAREMEIVASMQPNFVGRWGLPGGLYEDRIGGARASETNPFRRILDAGISLIFGSDSMPVSPLYGIHWAVNAPHAGQRVSVEEALRAYTLTPAEAVGEADLKGSITPGKVADIVVLSGDPRASSRRMESLSVDMTILAGRVVHHRP